MPQTERAEPVKGAGGGWFWKLTEIEMPFPCHSIPEELHNSFPNHVEVHRRRRGEDIVQRADKTNKEIVPHNIIIFTDVFLRRVPVLSQWGQPRPSINAKAAKETKIRYPGEDDKIMLSFTIFVDVGGNVVFARCVLLSRRHWAMMLLGKHTTTAINQYTIHSILFLLSIYVGDCL